MAKGHLSVAIVGHQGVGKTTLLESILYQLKIIKNKGNVQAKNTVSDYLPTEQAKGCSFKSSLVSFIYRDVKFNFIDLPGNLEMDNETLESIRAVDLCLLVIHGVKGLEIGTRRVWRIIKYHHIPTLIIVNKIDKELFKSEKILTTLKELGNDVCPVSLFDSDNQCYYDLLQNTKAGLTNWQPNAKTPLNQPNLLALLSEKLAESSEKLLEKYLQGQTLSQSEISQNSVLATQANTLYPVFFISSKFDVGIDSLMDFLLLYQKQIPPRLLAYSDEELTQPLALNDGITRLYCFKTTVDPYLGTINYIKVLSGTLRVNSELTSLSGTLKKISNLNLAFGKQLTPLDEALPGDIVVTTKLDLKTNHRYWQKNNLFYLPPIKYFTPVIYRVIKPIDHKDENKISTALAKIRLEDPGIEVINNEEKKELLIGSMGLTHLSFILERLHNLFNLNVTISEPHVNYRETISRKVEAEGKHKKQSGGAGQFGHVFIRFEPNEEIFTFNEEIFGGAVPKNFFPAIAKGLEEALQNGPLGGYPVIFVKATLYDGSYHPVDSNEISFKLAAQLAFKEACKTAKPVLLEPIMRIKVTVRDEYVGDIMGDINKRRGKVLGLEPAILGEQIINAEVPESEIINYAIDLKQMTQGEALFKRSFLRYEAVPDHLVSTIITAKK